MDFDPEYLLFANYIPFPCVLFDVSLIRKAGGFDAGLEYSEDWDLLIRLSREAPFRHVRAVTAYYRVFEGEEGHVEAGGAGFIAARRTILERYRRYRNDETAVGVLDRISRRLWEISAREFQSAGELVYQRASHRRFSGEIHSLEECLAEVRGQSETLKGEVEYFRTEVAAEVHALYAEIARLTGLIHRMEGTKAWRFHRWMQNLRRTS
jgi:hypothetical protein